LIFLLTENIQSTVSHRQRFAIIAITSISYYLLYRLNMTLFGSLNFSHRVDWIFLPSGLRLAFVLLFLADGAVGIALASTLITYLLYFDGSYISMLLTGSMAGLAPYLARQVAVHQWQLDKNLKNLKAIGILKISVLFAFISALVHQLWYFWNGKTNDFIASASVMMVGDLLGTLIVLFALKIMVPSFNHLKKAPD
jgi:hypothetical protein